MPILKSDYLTATQRQSYATDGHFIVRELFSADEVAAMQRAAADDPTIHGDALHRRDGEGGVTRLRVWNEADDSVFGRVPRLERIVRRMELMLHDEVYFYHAKLMLKEPRTGGAWAWHQDYGYWYNNGCLLPDMGSCMIALDKATPENGCLQVLSGSQRLGRVDHVKVGDQTGADPERVEHARRHFDLVHVELDPGDALFFHANLLHRSDQNRSENPRWTFICCYNARSNDPFKQHHHPGYHPLDAVPDEGWLGGMGLGAASE